MNKKSIIIILIEIIGIVLLYFLINSDFIQIISKCWIYETTGVQCISCGGTRFVQYLLQGKIIEAFLSHIVFFLGFIYLFLVNIVYIINLNKKKKILTWLYPKYWYIIIFVIILIIYAIARNLL